MDVLQSRILDQIRVLLAEIGHGGGKISASVYDTAQLLRYAPPPDPLPTLHWLCDQQQIDGGWGEPNQPHYRQTATLAAVLALKQYHYHFSWARDAAEAGRMFFLSQADVLVELREDMAVAAELILLRLLEEAHALGLALPEGRYAALLELGQRRRALIASTRPGAGTTAAHSWEAWGVEPDPALIDASGGVGHSPAATAAWLHSARGRSDLLLHRQRAHTYLAHASAATATGIPGVFPTVWPNDRFEQIFGLFALSCAGLTGHPLLREIVEPQIRELAQTIEPHGVSFSSFFTPDGDDTATAMIVLAQSGHRVSERLLAPFERSEHFATWPGELHMSLSTTAHAVHALALLGRSPAQSVAELIRRQQSDGCWRGDKWHSSPFYTTSQAMLALVAAGQEQQASVERAVEWLLNQQQGTGGWGTQHTSQVETAYVVLALQPFVHLERVREAIRCTCSVLLGERTKRPAHWIAKVLYEPYHVDRLFELSAAWIASCYNVSHI